MTNLLLLFFVMMTERFIKSDKKFIKDIKRYLPPNSNGLMAFDKPASASYASGFLMMTKRFFMSDKLVKNKI